MSKASQFRIFMALSLCLLLARPAFPQTGLGNIGPSKGQVIAAIAGAAAVITAVGFLIYHKTHKHSSITGCLASVADGLVLQNEKDKKVYVLSGNSAGLKGGDRVTVKGKKTKDSSGKPSLQVEALTKNFGTCTV